MKFDFKNPAERGVFQTATKLVTYVVIVAESVVYAIAVYGPGVSEPYILYILIGQLMGASIIVMFLDETIQKGWGLGSGISIFIMAGVAQQILWSLFSPMPAGDGGAIGVFPFLGQMAAYGDVAALHRMILDSQSLKRLGMPVDIANLVAFLVSPDAAFITGQSILCDGGWAFQ